MVVLTTTPPLTKSPPPTPDSAPFSANVLLTMATAEDSEWRPPPWLSPVWLSTMVVPMIVALPAGCEIAMPPPPASERLPLIVLLMTVTAAGLKMPPPWLCTAVLLATVLPAMNSRPRLAIPPPPLLLPVELKLSVTAQWVLTSVPRLRMPPPPNATPPPQWKTAATPCPASPMATTSTIKMIHTARLHGRLLPAGPFRLSIARSSIGSNRMSAGHQYPAQIFSALTGGLNA